jgi:1,4-dihydroxy-2-naphthoyl-CoA synthase
VAAKVLAAMAEYETLRYERDDHVVTLTYDRPEQRNAISRAMNTELHHAWQRFRDDDEAFVLVSPARAMPSAPAGTSRTRPTGHSPTGTSSARTW